MTRKRPPIANFTDEYFGCMTIPILIIASVIAAWLTFSGALKRWWNYMVGY